jgi:hypothetical protein
VLNAFGEELVRAYRQGLGERNVHASSNLSDSICYKVKAGDRWMAVDISLLDYWQYVEYGRRAGKFPPIDSIEAWIKVKGIQPMTRIQTNIMRRTQHRGSIRRNDGRIPSIRSLAYLIGRKIKEEGIQPRPILATALDDTLQRFDEAINEAITLDIANFIDIYLDEIYNIE